METTITRQFVVLSLHPEKGRKVINDNPFRYALAGAYLMDMYRSGEISLTGNRMTHSYRNTGDLLHDKIAERIERSSRPRKFSYWVRVLSNQSRHIFMETVKSLVMSGYMRHDKKYFLNIIPFNRYYFNDPGTRNRIIEGLREVLIHNRQAKDEELMLIGLIKASQAYRLLVKEKGERSIIRKKCRELMEKDIYTSEIEKVIREVKAAIISAAVASAIATRGAN